MNRNSGLHQIDRMVDRALGLDPDRHPRNPWMNPVDCTCEHVHCSDATCRSQSRSRGAVPEIARIFPAAPEAPKKG